MLATLGLGVEKSTAQISLNVNIGAQPSWGPAGYEQASYYYLPDIETYYYVPKKQFIYLNNGKWMFTNSLPSRYASYNLYNGYKVVLNSPRPYLNFESDRSKYSKYKGWKGKQATLKSKGIPPGQAKKMVGSRSAKPFTPGNGNGNGKGNGDGKGNGHGNGNGKGKGKH